MNKKKMYILSIVGLAVLVYLIISFILYNSQRSLLYHPTENNYQNDQILFNYEEIFIKVDEEIELKSWLIKKDFKKYKTIVIFHGNAGHLSNRIYKLNELYKLDIRKAYKNKNGRISSSML